jgi:hypothetical protein
MSEEVCGFCGAKYDGMKRGEHLENCEEYKKFEELIKEFEHKVSKFIETHPDRKVLYEFYYHIPNRILRKIRFLMEKDEIAKNDPKWFRDWRQKQFVGWIQWLDHHFARKNGELVGEPYYLSKKDVESLIAFCEENNLDFYIIGESLHLPGHTLRVVMFKKGEKK